MADTAAAWYDVLGQFKAKFQEFLNVRNSLIQQYAVVKDNPALYAEWKKLMARSDTIYNAATSVNNQIKSGMDWLKDTFGINLSGAELGFIPVVIGVAGVAAAVATMTYFITDYLQFNSRLEVYKQTGDKSVLESQGLTTSLRAVSDITKNVLPLALLAAGLYYGPKFLKGR